jgi:hypothetical protein
MIKVRPGRNDEGVRDVNVRDRSRGAAYRCKVLGREVVLRTRSRHSRFYLAWGNFQLALTYPPGQRTVTRRAEERVKRQVRAALTDGPMSAGELSSALTVTLDEAYLAITALLQSKEVVTTESGELALRAKGGSDE